MASTVPTDSSTEETTNFARLCRLLVDVGTQVLRETFNNIHSPTNLQSTLATNRSTLQSLRTRKILNPNQWGKLFPAKPASVSSRDFDITLLMVLFRNICGLTAPATGWGALPAATDVSLEADVARVNYFRNTVFAHAEQASVDNATFSSHWNSIRDTLVRLGGVKHRAAIDHLETECMDPETEEHCIELLSQWKKDEDNVKDKLEELGSGLGKVIKKLDDLEAASIALKKEITVDEGKRLKPKEMTHGPGTCKEEYHEREPMDYYCTDCRVCICLKCGQTRHNHHNKMDIQKVAKEKKTQMAKLFERVKAKAVKVEEKMKEQTKFMKKSEDEIYSAEKRLTETVEQKIRLLNEHKTAVKKELSEICKAQQTEHASKMESFEVFLNELRESAEFGEDVVKQSTALEIVQGECASVLDRCEELLNAEEMEIYQPMYVTYRVNKETAGFVPGEVVAFHKLIDPLQSTAEGEGLKEAQVAAESHFTVTIRDSEGNRCPITKAKVSVKIYSPTEEDVQTKIEDCKDGMYKVSYKPKSVGVHDVAIETNGTPLTGSPWRVQVIPHRYKSIAPFTSFDEKQGQFRYPQSIAVSETTGNIAIGDLVSLGVQLFDSKWKYLRTITDRGTMGHASSVAFTASGDVIVIHENKMIVSTEHGSFIKNITEHLISPGSVSVGKDGNLIVCDRRDKMVKVISSDGTKLIQSIRAPDCYEIPDFAICYQDKFFVLYGKDSCVRVFSKDGQLLYKIGCKGTGDGQLREPTGLTIDRFGNLVVCDDGNKRIQFFSLEGKFLNSVNEEMESPISVAISKTGDLLVCDSLANCIHILH